jgi:hypothetical protein
MHEAMIEPGDQKSKKRDRGGARRIAHCFGRRAPLGSY